MAASYLARVVLACERIAADRMEGILAQWKRQGLSPSLFRRRQTCQCVVMETGRRKAPKLLQTSLGNLRGAIFCENRECFRYDAANYSGTMITRVCFPRKWWRRIITTDNLSALMSANSTSAKKYIFKKCTEQISLARKTNTIIFVFVAIESKSNNYLCDCRHQTAPHKEKLCFNLSH